MRRAGLMGVALVGLSLAAGCDRQDASQPAPASGGISGAAAPAASTAGPTSPSTAPSGAATAADTADRATGALGDATAGARDAATQGAAAAQTQATGVAQMTADEARTKLDQAMNYVKENKLDLADKALTQVEQHKASLPQSLQDRLATVRGALNTAKATGGIKVPNFGGAK